MFKLRLCFFSGIVIIFSCLFSFSAFAISNSGITVTRSKIEFNAGTDQGKSTQFYVKNTGEEEMFVKIEKADFYIAENGAFIVAENGATPYSAGSFISCDESEFILKPGEKIGKDVTFKEGMKFLIPEYMSAILVRYMPRSTAESDANIKTCMQVAITIRIKSDSMMENVDTNIPPLELISFSGKKLMGSGMKKTVEITVNNNGLLTVEPEISGVVNSVFSGLVEEIPEIKGYIMPGRTRTYKIAVDSSSVFDIRTIHLNYEYDYVNKKFSDKCSFTYVILSYQLAIGILLLIAGIILQIWIFRKRKMQLKLLLEQNMALAKAAAATTSSEAGEKTSENDSKTQDNPETVKD
jgi:hypothetical protein